MENEISHIKNVCKQRPTVGKFFKPYIKNLASKYCHLKINKILSLKLVKKPNQEILINSLIKNLTFYI